MDMKKLLGIVSDDKQKQLNESIEECGSMPSSSMPAPGNFSMSVNLNAQGVDNIKELLNLMSKADAPSRMSEPMAMPEPGMDMPIKITSIKPAGSDGDRGMDQIKDLVRSAGIKKDFANEPEEAYAGLDSVTTDAGGGMQEPKDPADIRVKDPSGYQQAEEYANEPDEKVSDHHTMIKDLSGGLNREKQQYKKEYPGDSPMAVRESSIRQQLDAMWKEIKESRADETMYYDPKLMKDIEDTAFRQSREKSRAADNAELAKQSQDAVDRDLRARLAKIGMLSRFKPGMSDQEVKNLELSKQQIDAAQAERERKLRGR